MSKRIVFRRFQRRKGHLKLCFVLVVLYLKVFLNAMDKLGCSSDYLLNNSFGFSMLPSVRTSAETIKQDSNEVPFPYL